MSSIVPIPQVPIAVRPATLADVPFMDGLQKKYGKALGYFPTKQFEEYVEMGGVLVAEELLFEVGDLKLDETSNPQTLKPQTTNPVGYCISRDRYLKRDELGVIYQLCVAPGTQRKLVGASLVKEVFERSAYGCKLCCCWCAQDLDANYFWESLGFLPVAFRAGSTGNGRRPQARVHIFWQRRIGAADVATPYWYPFQTNGGAIRQDRIVFPIPPGVHWKDVEAVVVPGMDRGSGIGCRVSGEKRRRSSSSRTPKPEPRDPSKVAIVVGGRIKYIDRPGYVAPEATSELALLPAPALAPAPKPPKPKRPAEKLDPKFLAAARELRDRYLEQFNSGMILPAGKYEVSRALVSSVESAIEQRGARMPLLPAA